MIKFYLLGIILFLFSSCSEIKLTSRTSYISPPEIKVDKVYFLTQFDSIPKIYNLIGEFRMKENDTGDWSEIHKKLKDFAIENNANTLKVDAYHVGGYGTKGNQGFISGRLFYTNIDSLTNKSNANDSIYLYVIRYEKDNLIATNCNIDLVINNKATGLIDNLSYYKMRINVGDTLKIATSKQRTKFDFIIDKKSDYYIKVCKQTQQRQPQRPMTGFSISIGDVDFYKLSSLNGRLELENIIQIKNLK